MPRVTTMEEIPTKQQIEKMKELSSLGFSWNQQKSASEYKGVYFSKKQESYFFGIHGEIEHLPTGI